MDLQASLPVPLACQIVIHFKSDTFLAYCIKTDLNFKVIPVVLYTLLCVCVCMYFVMAR